HRPRRRGCDRARDRARASRRGDAGVRAWARRVRRARRDAGGRCARVGRDRRAPAQLRKRAAAGAVALRRRARSASCPSERPREDRRRGSQRTGPYRPAHAERDEPRLFGRAAERGGPRGRGRRRARDRGVLVTVETAAARRTVIDLGADATILDAARSLASVESPDIVLVVPSGAPLTRNAVFLEALRRRAGDRRIVLVSPEARARSLASSVHMKAFASISALDRHELDATEHLTDARRAAMSTRVGRPAARRGTSPLRALAVFMSLVTAAGILLAVVGPSATIVIAATPTPLGPFEYDLRAGPNGGDIRADTMFEPNLIAKTTGTATGTKPDETKATGQELFKNLTTNDIRVPIGTLVQTS